MKKSGNIWDMLKEQGQNKVPCPGCDNFVAKTRLNHHLDVECSSLEKSHRSTKAELKNVSEILDSCCREEENFELSTISNESSSPKSIKSSKREPMLANKSDLSSKSTRKSRSEQPNTKSSPLCQKKNYEVECPACSVVIVRAQLNQHLDFECSSSKQKIPSNNASKVQPLTGIVVSAGDFVVQPKFNVSASGESPKNVKNSKIEMSSKSKQKVSKKPSHLEEAVTSHCISTIQIPTDGDVKSSNGDLQDKGTKPNKEPLEKPKHKVNQKPKQRVVKSKRDRSSTSHWAEEDTELNDFRPSKKSLQFTEFKIGSNENQKLSEHTASRKFSNKSELDDDECFIEKSSQHCPKDMESSKSGKFSYRNSKRRTKQTCYVETTSKQTELNDPETQTPSLKFKDVTNSSVTENGTINLKNDLLGNSDVNESNLENTSQEMKQTELNDPEMQTSSLKFKDVTNSLVTAENDTINLKKDLSNSDVNESNLENTSQEMKNSNNNSTSETVSNITQPQNEYKEVALDIAPKITFPEQSHFNASSKSRSWMFSSKIPNPSRKVFKAQKANMSEEIDETESDLNDHGPIFQSSTALVKQNTIDNVSECLTLSEMEPKLASGATNYVPYYLGNFQLVIHKVLNDDYNKHLFSEEDHSYITAFNSASDGAQKLYVRLFQRKYKWLRLNKIFYPQIADDLSYILEELVIVGLMDSGEDDIDLKAALELLSLPEAKNLSKLFNFNACSKSKAEIVELLMKQAKQHKSHFFSQGSNSVSSAILKKVKEILGPCYRLALDAKRLFTRILMLFSLPTISEDDEEAAGGQQQQLLTLLQVNKGELVFPNYVITRKFMIFEDRESLLRYEIARQLENDIQNAVEAKDFKSAKILYLNAREEHAKLLKCSFTEREKEMPFFLKRYTALHVYTRCLNHGVEVLQRLRQYDEAVEQLRELLDQLVYCQDRRGKWWERIALNLEQHLKLPQKAADSIKEALQDSWVRVAGRLTLITRAERLVNRRHKIDCEFLKSCISEMHSMTEAPKVTIRGRLLPIPIPGRRHVFVSSQTQDGSSQNDVTVLGVENLAIEHYKTEGYTKGLHGEGSTFISLFALLFWDVIYDGSIPDVFISPYQTHPLDLNSDCFYQSREAQITQHLNIVKNADMQTLREIISSTWLSHKGRTSLVSWDNFSDVEDILGLACCFGGCILAGICERLAKNFRFTRSGVPDLVVWNPELLKVKIVEVKGPGDRLSPKQILWLDYLLKLGAEAEVCHVEASGSKKIRKD